METLVVRGGYRSDPRRRMSESFKTPGGTRPYDRRVNIDIGAATAFVTTHARILDRCRLRLLLGAGDDDQARAALAAYRNPDGGYGWGLEPDLRCAESQPGAALHAFELRSELDPGTGTDPDAVLLCDWLQSISLPDGGLPFARPISDPVGCSPWWVQADHTVSSLQITSAVAANAHRVAARDARVAAHPWLAAATRYCLATITAMPHAPAAYVLSFSLRFLDAIADIEPAAGDLIARLAGYLPGDGLMPVEGGVAGETLRPLDYAPQPGRPIRALLLPSIIDADLERLAALQQPDGGWPVDWASSSPAAALEWRGYVTVRAISQLKANHRLT
jgi:hypothetical protein